MTSILLLSAESCLTTDQSIGEVYDEVETDVGQQLLVDQFVDRASPSEEDLVKTTEATGVADITRVGHCHPVRPGWDWTGLNSRDCTGCVILAVFQLFPSVKF